MSNTKQKLRDKWKLIEEGKIEDDYTCYFLSHFGFFDIPEDMEKAKQRRDALYSDALVNNKVASNKTEYRSHE